MNQDLRFLMKVPDVLYKAAKLGKVIVDGAVIKDAETLKIVGHLQHVGSLGALVANANPATMAIMAASSIFSQYQHHQLDRKLEVIGKLSRVAAGASVLNIGVSVAGFALLAYQIKQLGSKVDGILGRIEHLQSEHDLHFHARLVTALERCEEAFLLNDQTLQQQWWRQQEQELHQLANVFLQRLAHVSQEHLLEQYEPAEVIELVTQWCTLSRARVDVLMLLNEPIVAMGYLGKVMETLESLQCDARAIYVLLSRRYPYLAPMAQRELVETCQSYALSFEHMSGDMYQIKHGLELMIKLDVDTHDYVMQVRSAEEPDVLLFVEDAQVFGRYA